MIAQPVPHAAPYPTSPLTAATQAPFAGKPRPAAQFSQPNHTTNPDAEQFFHLLYERRRGYLELAWIDSDPDDREHYIFDRTWFDYAPERLEELLGQIEELSQQYGNVYVSAQLYTAPRRSAPIVPGRAVFVDDLQTGADCSASVNTSPCGQHGYFLLDRVVAGEMLRELAKRAAYCLGGDKGGWDSQQLVRLPGTFNTKARHGGRYPVTLGAVTHRRYSPDELRALWPEVTAPEAELADLDWPEVEHWLGNLGSLIGENGLPRRMKPTTQTAQVLQSEPADTSLARYMVAKGLVLHGYPDAEIAALLWHLCEYDSVTMKGSAWLKADILRIIAKVRAECPGVRVNATRARGKGEPQRIAERPPVRRGRKATLTPAALLAWYEGARDCGDLVMLTVTQVAGQLQVSRSTVERCERTLRAAGQIERRTFNRRQSSLVALLQPAGTAGSGVPKSCPARRATSPHNCCYASGHTGRRPRTTSPHHCG